MSVLSIETSLRLSVGRLKKASEAKGVTGMVTTRDITSSYWKTGVSLAAHVQELADQVGRIEDCECIVEEVEDLLDKIRSTGIFSIEAFEDARLRWWIDRTASRSRPVFVGV